MVEPIFRREDVSVTLETPSTYLYRSEDSGKCLHINACTRCATKLYVTFERVPDFCGVYGGTFDDPAWFRIAPSNARHILIDAARPDTLLPAMLPMYRHHTTANDGTANNPIILDAPRTTGGLA